MRPRVHVLSVGLVLTVLAACGGNSNDTAAQGSRSSGASSSTPATVSPSATSTTPSASQSASAEMSSVDACALLDLQALEQAGLQPDPPRGRVLRASDSADVAAALDGRDALLTCDAGFSASAQVNDMPDEELAREEAVAALATAAATPSAVRSDLPPTLVPFGATVVDPEFQSASVQFQLRDLHVAIVLGYGSDEDLSVPQVQQLLEAQLTRALQTIG